MNRRFQIMPAAIIILIVLVLFALSGCAGRTKGPLSNQSIMELTTRVYDAEELDNIVKFNGSVTELDAQYPIECFRKAGEIYRAAYLGEGCVAVFVFDRDGRKILSRVYTTDQSKQDFEKIQKGCRLEEVQALDPKGEYLFLETGRNDFPRRSLHCTKDGYFITIEYDASSTVVAVDRDLI